MLFVLGIVLIAIGLCSCLCSISGTIHVSSSLRIIQWISKSIVIGGIVCLILAVIT
jgi:hypothetical protein